MSDVTCDVVRDCAADFALGALTGRERADLLAHLDRCPSCQTLVGEYAGVADALLDLVPEADPPNALAPPVLATLRPAPLRRWRRRVVALAAAAIVAISTATGVTWALVAGGDSGSAQHAALHSAAMVGSGGLTVGRVVSTEEEHPKLAVSVDYWVADGSYRLQALDGNGSSVPVGTLQVAGGRGTWTGRVASGNHPVAVTLVDPGGSVVCRGPLA
ncbi:MAG TPA: zf-HC2 domain-containing protein [Acidimicrobiia bacterium]|nr:zf-HC2 domain-containing protein [Acidimicrobiia bacterium]